MQVHTIALRFYVIKNRMDSNSLEDFISNLPKPMKYDDVQTIINKYDYYIKLLEESNPTQQESIRFGPFAWEYSLNLLKFYKFGILHANKIFNIEELNKWKNDFPSYISYTIYLICLLGSYCYDKVNRSLEFYSIPENQTDVEKQIDKNKNVYNSLKKINAKYSTQLIKFPRTEHIFDNIKYNEESRPTMIIMCGLPFSGKSTLAKHMEKYCSDIIIINLDEIDRNDHARVICDNIKNNKLVVIDKCNLSSEDRKEWINLNVSGKIWCIFINTPVEECLYRAAKHNEDNKKKIETLQIKLQQPNKDEGFSQIIELSKFDEINYQMEQWKFPLIVEKMENNLIKFPRTRHLYNLGSASRDDLLMTKDEQMQFINSFVCVTEKIDGSNIAFSIDPDSYKIMIQNRSHYVNSKYHKQYEKLDVWINNHSDNLFKILEPARHILYGEWLYAKHSINYTKLPGYFVAFDLYDKIERKFYSRSRLENLLQNTGIPLVPLIMSGKFNKLDSIVAFVKMNSHYYDGPVEGVYVKLEDHDWVLNRGKIVRENFISGNEHWTKNILTINSVNFDTNL